LTLAVSTAAALPGVSVVVVPIGVPEATSETESDSLFVTPVSHTPESFVSTTGHSGFETREYPAFFSEYQLIVEADDMRTSHSWPFLSLPPVRMTLLSGQ